MEEASQILSDLATWVVHSPTAADVLDATHLQERYRTSFWDAMIVTSAVRLGCDILWSEDLNPGQVGEKVQVRCPF
jgi:predicted nucleic acid-binding protein